MTIPAPMLGQTLTPDTEVDLGSDSLIILRVFLMMDHVLCLVIATATLLTQTWEEIRALLLARDKGDLFLFWGTHAAAPDMDREHAPCSRK